ncbi:hypothetical protein A9264_08960 [Vibrio sp. UCD-FRSSP16_10]|uniref:hypothetical protein n=1 Tax=unclassified Vibrio TaxID=2614977 RepID=UPI0007FF1415|nr:MULTISPECIES: hypothetical protein [unclassified Vibrio]OBT09390.1 hypothetical protein A9260_06060 [Vibrio sp. UCD-FRSSP16_30]OBT22069.1 hypothetical protein A9264_08960 [Vibrio sp. UCD-FRSSP16_10]
MLKDIVIQALKAVQNDCLSLSQHHYPTVHNKGMSNRHLTSLVERRLIKTADAFGFDLSIEPVEISKNTPPSKSVYRRITTQHGTVWLFPYSIKTANKVFKSHLLETLFIWRKEYAYAIQPNDCVVLVCDHWLSRINTSQQLLDWWHNRLPDNCDNYAQHGVLLSPSQAPRLDDLLHTLELQPCYKTHTHPLKKEEDGSQVTRYVHLYGIFECK